MNTTAPKIVLDTNILLAVISRKSPFRWIFDCIIKGEIILCISNEILFKYQEILTRKLSPEVAGNIINFLTINPFTKKTDIYFSFGLIYQDSDDNKFVDCAIASNAICIVSNDNHFQILKKIEFPQILVLKLQEFEDKYKDEQFKS